MITLYKSWVWAAQRLLKPLECLSYCGKQPSNDWKFVSVGAPGVVPEKEGEPIWEIHFD